MHLFAPDGALLATTDKVNLLVGVEDGAPGGLGLTRGDAAKLPIVTTPLGTLATLIGYDAFGAPRTATERFVAVGEQITVRGGCAIVANPAGSYAHHAAGWPSAIGAGARGASRRHRAPRRRLLDLRYAGASEIVTREASGEVRVVARAPSADHGGHVVAVAHL